MVTDISDYDYHLPQDLIAQDPLPERDGSRLMVVERASGAIAHRTFRCLPEFLAPGDTLVVNDAQVAPARIVGRRATGAVVQALVIDADAAGFCRLLLRPAARLKQGERLAFEEGAITLTLLDRQEDGLWLAQTAGGPIGDALWRVGRAPLPPYIRRPAGEDPRRQRDRQRYQTVFARACAQSIAAPTAGLHFTKELLVEVARRGVRLATLTLHVGLGTFEPICGRRIEDHRMHAEAYEFPAAAAEACAAAREAGRRIVAVGTTCVRTLETVWQRHGRFAPDSGMTDLYIRPPYSFHAVDALVTNFHLPRSSLLILVAAFAGRDLILRAYKIAIEERYRFYSYGDAMLIL